MAWLTRSYAWLRRLCQRSTHGTLRWRRVSTAQAGIVEGTRRRRAPAQPPAASAEGMPLGDDVVLQLIAGGNQQALRTLYDRYSRRVFSLALHITGDRRQAEDVTEEVFVLVWHHHRLGQSRCGTVQEWIVAITRHRALAAVRSPDGTACHRAVASAPTGLGVRDARDPYAPQAELRDTLRQALATLPADQRQVLEQVYYGGRTAAALAADAEVPIGTMQTCVRRALLTLRTARTHAADTRGAHEDQARAAERAVGE